jgi:hypothetical protein
MLRISKHPHFSTCSQHVILRKVPTLSRLAKWHFLSAIRHQYTVSFPVENKRWFQLTYWSLCFLNSINCTMEIMTVSILPAATAKAECFILANHVCVFVCPLRCTSSRKQIMTLRADWLQTNYLPKTTTLSCMTVAEPLQRTNTF